MLKILQVSLQQYMNWELPDIQAGFQKGRGTRNQTTSIHWIIEKAIPFLWNGIQKKKFYFCFTDYTKVFDCMDHNKLWKILKVMRIPDQFTCLIRSESCSVVSDCLQPHGLHSVWNSPGQNTGVSSLSLLQQIFPTQPRDRTQVSCIAGRFFTSWAIKEAPS